MSDLLLDVNLQQVPDHYLSGRWQVTERILSQASSTTALAQATALHLHAEGMELTTPTGPTIGHWSVNRDAVLSRPYLQLYTADDNTTALVTRLRRSVDGQRSTLTLYFQSGMELHLLQS